jgi:hypothetical protein
MPLKQSTDIWYISTKIPKVSQLSLYTFVGNLLLLTRARKHFYVGHVYLVIDQHRHHGLKSMPSWQL